MAYLVELVEPMRYHCSVVVMVYRRIKPKVTGAIGKATYCSHQGDILTPCQLMRTERSADGREGLACYIHRSIAVGGQRVYRAHAYLSLLTIRVNCMINDHVICSEAVMGCPIHASHCRKQSQHLAPGRGPVRSRDSEDDVTNGKLRDTSDAFCPLFDFHFTRHTGATCSDFGVKTEV